MQGFCVLHAAGNRVGQVDLIPLAVQVYLVPSVVAGAGVALGQCTRDALAAAHCCKQRGEIVADTGGAFRVAAVSGMYLVILPLVISFASLLS